MLSAMRGEMPDVIPFAPRLDLCFNANKGSENLPEKYRGCGHHLEIARAQGWALHQINPAYQDIRKPEDNLHWALGILTYKEKVYGYRFKGDLHDIGKNLVGIMLRGFGYEIKDIGINRPVKEIIRHVEAYRPDI
jgi:hypothetical protein